MTSVFRSPAPRYFHTAWGESEPFIGQTIHQVIFALPHGNHHNQHAVVEYLIHKPEPGATQFDLITVRRIGETCRFNARFLEPFGQTFLELLPYALVELMPLFPLIAGYSSSRGTPTVASAWRSRTRRTRSRSSSCSMMMSKVSAGGR